MSAKGCRGYAEGSMRLWAWRLLLPIERRRLRRRVEAEAVAQVTGQGRALSEAPRIRVVVDRAAGLARVECLVLGA